MSEHMDGTERPVGADLASKIGRLVEERGWNQEDFARIARVNRHTARQILKAGAGRRLHNATISQCAAALGLSVSELRNLPLERLLPRMHGRFHPDDASLQTLLERATQPDLLAWLQRNPERAAQLRADEAAELLSMQGPSSPFATLGVDQMIDRIERRRKLIDQIRVVAASEYLPMVEVFMGLLCEKLQPKKLG